MLNFCTVCDNMYYIRIGETEPATLHYYCRHCGHVDDQLVVKNISVLSVSSDKYKQNLNNFVNKYTKFDPTLPRTTDIPCPNVDCNKHHDNKNTMPEIVYLRYDQNNLKYIYICSNCDTTWTN